MKNLYKYISNDMKSFKTSLEESLLDDEDDLINTSDIEVYTHNKIGKHCRMICPMCYSERTGHAVITIYGDTKRMLNIFDSKKLKAFNKNLHKFDNVGIWNGYNVSSRKIFTDNKIEPLCNVFLNMDKKWLEDNNYDAIKEYLNNIVKDGWGKYLIIDEGLRRYRPGVYHDFVIRCGLCPKCSMEIYFKNKMSLESLLDDEDDLINASDENVNNHLTMMNYYDLAHVSTSDIKEFVELLNKSEIEKLDPKYLFAKYDKVIRMYSGGGIVTGNRHTTYAKTFLRHLMCMPIYLEYKQLENIYVKKRQESGDKTHEEVFYSQDLKKHAPLLYENIRKLFKHPSTLKLSIPGNNRLKIDGLQLFFYNKKMK